MDVLMFVMLWLVHSDSIRRGTGTQPTPYQIILEMYLEQFFLIKLKYHLIIVEIDFFLIPDEKFTQYP